MMTIHKAMNMFKKQYPNVTEPVVYYAEYENIYVIVFGSMKAIDSAFAISKDGKYVCPYNPLVIDSGKLIKERNVDSKVSAGMQIATSNEHKERVSHMANNELNHSLKGAMRAGHKYISRTMKNGKWRYKYAKAANAGKAKVDKIRQKVDRAITTPSESKTRDAVDVITKGPWTEIRPGVKTRSDWDDPAGKIRYTSSKVRKNYADKKLEEYKHGKISKSDMDKVLENTHLDNDVNKKTVNDIDRVQRKGREIVEKWKNRKKK
jgi:hypothetical protein